MGAERPQEGIVLRYRVILVVWVISSIAWSTRNYIAESEVGFTRSFLNTFAIRVTEFLNN